MLSGSGGLVGCLFLFCLLGFVFREGSEKREVVKSKQKSRTVHLTEGKRPHGGERKVLCFIIGCSLCHITVL